MKKDTALWLYIIFIQSPQAERNCKKSVRVIE